MHPNDKWSYTVRHSLVSNSKYVAKIHNYNALKIYNEMKPEIEGIITKPQSQTQQINSDVYLLKDIMYQ